MIGMMLWEGAYVKASRVMSYSSLLVYNIMHTYGNGDCMCVFMDTCRTGRLFIASIRDCSTVFQAPAVSWVIHLIY